MRWRRGDRRREPRLTPRPRIYLASTIYWRGGDPAANLTGNLYTRSLEADAVVVVHLDRPGHLGDFRPLIRRGGRGRREPRRIGCACDEQ